jgi:hypothetical protein
LWQLELTTQFRATLVLGCKGTKPEYGPHFRQTQKVNQNSLQKHPLCLNVLYQPLTYTWLNGSVCKMHIPKMLMVLYWPPAAHTNPFFVEQSAAAAHNNNHLDYLKQITFK